MECKSDLLSAYIYAHTRIKKENGNYGERKQ